MLQRIAKLAGALALATLLQSGLPAQDQNVSPAAVQGWNEQGRHYVLVDVRSENAYNAAHLPGAVNIPLPLIPHKTLPAGVDIVLYDNDLSGNTARKAALALAQEDKSNVYILSGGLRGWEGGEQEVVRVSATNPFANVISAEDLQEARRIGMDLDIVDIRDAKSFAKSSIGGAVNVPVLKTPEEMSKSKSDALEYFVNLSPSAKRSLDEKGKGATPQEIAQLVAKDLSTEVSAKREKAGKPRKPHAVILVDDGSGISKKLLEEMPRIGVKNAYVLDNGIAGWNASRTEANPRSETIIHSSAPVGGDSH